MKQISTPPQASAEVVVNEAFETLGHQEVYGKRHDTTAGLTWGFYGGRWGGFSVVDGTVTLTNATTNYLVVARDTGVLTTSTALTNWNDRGGFLRVYQLTTAGSVVTATQDHRAGPGGVHGLQAQGLPGIVSRSAAYTFTLADLSGGVIQLHPSADTTARTWTIPANATVPASIGSRLTIINQNAAGVLTLAITTDTQRLAGAGTTGSRTLAANGRAVLEKVSATEWLVSGVGLT
jgi:hypothetical protein